MTVDASTQHQLNSLLHILVHEEGEIRGSDYEISIDMEFFVGNVFLLSCEKTQILYEETK